MIKERLVIIILGEVIYKKIKKEIGYILKRY